MRSSLLALGQHIGRTDCRQVVICIISEAHRNPALHEQMESTLYFSRIELIIQAFRLTESSGMFRRPKNIDILIEQLYGAAWHKVMIRFE
jgi:hypothetical protein